MLDNQMIRDYIVVEICNAALSEKLQMDADLMLKKATTAVWQSEALSRSKLLWEDKLQRVIALSMQSDKFISKKEAKGSRYMYFTNRQTHSCKVGQTTITAWSSLCCSRYGKSPG